MKSKNTLGLLAIFSFTLLGAAPAPSQAEKTKPAEAKIEDVAKPAAPAEPKAEVAKATAEFKSACVKLLSKDKKVKNPGARCGCVANNLAAKLKIAEIQLLTKVYQGNEKAENDLELTENLPLQDYELEVSQNCLADANWKVAAE